jgi:hypothetical protein
MVREGTGQGPGGGGDVGEVEVDVLAGKMAKDALATETEKRAGPYTIARTLRSFILL